MMLNTPGNKLPKDAQAHVAQQEVQIQALSHLIDADFDPQMSCHAVCLLLSQLFDGSDDRINQMVAQLATKALNSTVEVKLS